MRPASRLVKQAVSSRSSIVITAQGKIADAKSILSILLLCATFGTMLSLEVSGEDETAIAQAIEQLFNADDIDTDMKS